ncbi:hypothetical protein [Metallosphaera hakonensis]
MSSVCPYCGVGCKLKVNEGNPRKLRYESGDDVR